MSEDQGQENKKVEGKTEAQDIFEGLEDLVSFFLHDYRTTVQAVAYIPGEVVGYAVRLLDEENNFINRNFLAEALRVQAINDLIVEIVKSNTDYGFFTWRDNVKRYLEIMSKLASVWKAFDTADRPEKDVKVDQLLEKLEAVEKSLRSLILNIINNAYHCDDSDEEGCCDDEPDEPEDDPGYDEEELEEL